MYLAVLEDDHDQQELLKVWLGMAQHQVKCMDLGASFIEALKRERFDLLIIDWMLPDYKGDVVLRWIRENLGWELPVIVLTSRDDETNIVSALKMGADDYIVKPAKAMELLARIEVLSRRARRISIPALHLGRYELDPERRRAALDGHSVELTQKEFDLLVYLFENPGKLLSRMHLLEKIWGIHADVDTRTVDTHVSRLRKKLQLEARNGWQLVPIYGYGYRFERVDEPGGAAPA